MDGTVEVAEEDDIILKPPVIFKIIPVNNRNVIRSEMEDKYMKAINIQWDTDGDNEILEYLPAEIEIPEGMTEEDEISDYLSDQTGFCHEGFGLSN